jgi:drug/metabolite transporter (DMT)-like permease
MIQRVFPYLVAVFAGVTASLSPVLGKPLYEVLHPFQTVFLFGTLGFFSVLFLLVITQKFDHSNFIGKDRLLRIALMGYGFQSIPLFVINYGLVGTPSVVVLMMKRIQPILLILLLFVLKKKKPDGKELCIALAAVFGIYLLINRVGLVAVPEFFLNIRLLAVFTAVLIWALMFIYAKGLLHDLDCLHASLGIMFCISTSMLIPTYYLGLSAFSQLDQSHWLLILVTGFFCYGWGLPAVYFGLKCFSPVFMSIAMLIGPVVATVLANVVFGEPVTWWQVLGGLLILISVLVMTLTRENAKRSGI